MASSQDKKKRTALLFIEWPEQLEAALAATQPYSSYIIVAVNVNIAAYLESREIEFITVDSQLNWAKHFLKTNNSYESLERLCDELDIIVQNENKKACSCHIRPFFYNYYFIKTWSDHFDWLIACIKSLLEKHKTKRVIYFYNSKFCENDYFWNMSDSLIGLVLAECFESLEKTSLEYQPHLITSYVPLKDKYSKFASNDFSISLIKRIYNKCLSIVRKLASRRFQKCYFSVHSIIPDHTAYKFKSRKIDVSQWFNSISESNEPAMSFNNEDLWCKMKTYYHPGIVKILRPKIERLILNKIPDYIAVYEKSHQLIQHYKPKFLEMATGVMPEHKIMAQAFRGLGKKVIIMQHGALGQHIEKTYYYNDFLVATDYLVYGQGVKDYIQTQYPRLKLNIHVVGNNKINHFKLSLTKHKLCKILGFNPKLPLFVFQIPGAFHHIFYNSFNSEGDFLEYKRLKEVIQYFKSNKKIQLVLKLHRNLNCPQNPLELYKDKESNIRFMRDIDLSTLTNAADYFITDRPSTGMFEALTMKKTVLAYNSVIRFWGKDKLLKKAIYFFHSFESFIKFLKNEEKIKEIQKIFIEKYEGLFINDGSFNRNIEILYHELISQK